MSIDILAARNPADKRSPDDIVSGLITTVEVALIRGAAEINDSTPINNVTLTTNYRSGVRNGQSVQVLDALQGQVWYGKIINIAHTSRLADVFTELTIERRIQ